MSFGSLVETPSLSVELRVQLPAILRAIDNSGADPTSFTAQDTEARFRRKTTIRRNTYASDIDFGPDGSIDQLF